ncbi:MAG: hypothetical protein KAS21_10460 [Candidatus Aminicenantes bacterium]|nr:hypothetical protein [Candidatus Aminicenantes bacterium]MCK5005504.1 hypothetical protein [Candidatus Aminicenantes bacterium]
MKRKIYLILLLILFFFVFDRGAALIFREINFSFYSNTTLKKNIFGKSEVMKKGFYDSLIFGTSRTLNSIHPLYLHKYLGFKAYKVAKQDRYPEYYYLLYKRFKDSFGKPKYLFYGVDYFMFKMRTSKIPLMSVSKKKKKIRKINFKKLLKRNPGALNYISILYRSKNKIDKTFDDILYKLSLDWDSSDVKNLNSAGISNYKGKKTVIASEFRTKPNSWEKSFYTNSDNGEGESLKLLFDELERDGVKVFLIGIPDFIGTYETNVQKDLFTTDMRSLIKSRRGFWFLDYNHLDKFDLNNGDNFKDGRYGHENSHLSYYGSIPFNKMLADDIAKIIKSAGD